MNINEVLGTQQLTELNWKHALATGAVAAASLAPFAFNKAPTDPAATGQAVSGAVSPADAKKQRDAIAKLKKQKGPDVLAQAILSQFKHIPPNQAEEIAKLARKHAKPGFPTALDLISIMGVESSFDPNAVSKLKTDPAVGLMQVRPEMWGTTQDHLLGDLDAQVALGSKIMHRNFVKFGNEEDAMHAYNVGVRNVLRGKNLNPRYAPKIQKLRKTFDEFIKNANKEKHT